MGPNWILRLSGVSAILLIAGAAPDENSLDTPPKGSPPAVSGASDPSAKQAGPTAAQAAAPAATKPVASEKPQENAPADTASARAEATERLKSLAGLNEKDLSAGRKALREAFEERLRWLDEYEKAAKERHEAEHPNPTPERQAAELKADLERVNASLSQAAKRPELLLPAVFRKLAAQVPDAVSAEMKEGIETAKAELKEWEGKTEKLQSSRSGGSTKSPASLRTERDQIHQRVVTLKALSDEREAAVAAAKSNDDRELAQARFGTFTWESRVQWERLKAVEAKMSLEAKRADLEELSLEDAKAHVAVAKICLEQMQSRYKTLASRQEDELKRKAASEERTATRSGDPLVRFRAQKMKRLLELEAYAVANENALTNGPSPTLEEQQSLADRADADLARVKKLLDDGRVSPLDALRLNNDFRRIGAERSRIVRKDLAAADALLSRYEGLLSKVELLLLNDSHDDRLEHEALLERLPKSRYAEAQAMFAQLDEKELALLTRDRAALQKLADRADQTHDQIERRIRILDEHYGFIRTNIFWVRDQEPIGAATLAQGQRELILLGRSLIRVVCDLGNRALWGRISVEFVLGLLGLVVLPWPLWRAHRVLTTSARAESA